MTEIISCRNFFKIITTSVQKLNEKGSQNFPIILTTPKVTYLAYYYFFDGFV